MRSSKSIRALFLVSLTCLLGICIAAGEGDEIPEEIVVVKTPPLVVKDGGNPAIEPRAVLSPEVGPQVVFGKAVMWVVDHSVKYNGWSFTGWSKTGLDEDFRPWRLHVGIISGELDANTADNLAQKSRCTPSYRMLEEWEQQRTNSMVFGIVFTKRF